MIWFLVFDSFAPKEKYIVSTLGLMLLFLTKSKNPGNQNDEDTLITLEKISVLKVEYSAKSPARE